MRIYNMLYVVMANSCILLSVIFVILSVSVNSMENNNYDEIDPIMDLLLNSEYDNDGMKPNENVDEKDHEETVIDGVPILYADGVWKCGNCTTMDKMKLLYNEVHAQDINYDDYVEEYLNVETQIGISLSNMRCITLQADDEMDVRLVTGACTGGQVTFGIMRAAHCLISVYG